MEKVFRFRDRTIKVMDVTIGVLKGDDFLVLIGRPAARRRVRRRRCRCVGSWKGQSARITEIL